MPWPRQKPNSAATTLTATLPPAPSPPVLPSPLPRRRKQAYPPQICHWLRFGFCHGTHAPPPFPLLRGAQLPRLSPGHVTALTFIMPMLDVFALSEGTACVDVAASSFAAAYTSTATAHASVWNKDHQAIAEALLRAAASPLRLLPAYRRLSFSGMALLGRVLDLIMHRRCCLQHFLLIVPLLCGCHGLSCPVPPRPCCCTGTSPRLALEVVLSGSSRRSCLVCRLRPARGCLRPRPCWKVFTFLLRRPSTRGCSACGSVPCLPRR